MPTSTPEHFSRTLCKSALLCYAREGHSAGSWLTALQVYLITAFWPGPIRSFMHLGVMQHRYAPSWLHLLQLVAPSSSCQLLL